MLCPKLHLMSLILLPATLLLCQPRTVQQAKEASDYLPTARTEPRSASLVLELDRAIGVLKKGSEENWETRDQYLVAFEKTPNTDSLIGTVADSKAYVQCAISSRLRIHQVWD